MSKSLGNFFTLRDLLAKGYSGREIRYLMLTAYYGAQFNFTIEGLQGAREALGRIDECLAKLRERAGNTVADADPAVLEQFSEALDNGLFFAGLDDNDRVSGCYENF